jgi:hypothetical protein
MTDTLSFIVHNLSFLERETGFEPATATLATWNSTTELLPQEEKLEIRNEKSEKKNRFSNFRILISSFLVDLRGIEPLTS